MGATFGCYYSRSSLVLQVLQVLQSVGVRSYKSLCKCLPHDSTFIYLVLEACFYCNCLVSLWREYFRIVDVDFAVVEGIAAGIAGIYILAPEWT